MLEEDEVVETIHHDVHIKKKKGSRVALTLFFMMLVIFFIGIGITYIGFLYFELIHSLEAFYRYLSIGLLTLSVFLLISSLATLRFFDEES